MRRWAHVSSLLALVSVLSRASFATAQSQSEANAARGGIVGRVLDGHRQPVAAAEVSVVFRDSVISHTHSDAGGAFELTRLAAGAYVVIVRRLGFKMRRLDVDVAPSGPATQLDVALIAMPAELEQVRIEASIDESKGTLREFYEHRARGQFGYFFGPENLERDKLRVASDIMRRVPGAKLVPSRFGHRILFRGCSPLVWIDGQRLVGAELDEVMDLDDVAAIEVYPSMAGLPAQYVGYESRCGVIAVWTRVS